MNGSHDVILHCQILVTGLIIGAFGFMVVRAMRKLKNRPPKRRRTDTFHWRTCEFCSTRFPSEAGRYGCPNCHGEGI
jgi:hypothetical protein